MQSFHHGFLVDTEKFAVRHGSGRTHAQELSSQTALSEKFSLTQYAQGCFLAGLGYNRESNFTFLDVEDGVCRVSLREYFLFLEKNLGFFAYADRGKEALRVDVAPFPCE
jgi:hypothetical protein